MWVAIVIVNGNGAGLMPACLDALFGQTRRADEIVVVDNGSTDGSVELVEARYPGCACCRWGGIWGWRAGRTPGSWRARASRSALNNETIAAPGWLEALVAPLEADPALGSTMSTMLFAHAPEWIASAGIAVYRNGLALEDRRREALGTGGGGAATDLRAVGGGGGLPPGDAR